MSGTVQARLWPYLPWPSLTLRGGRRGLALGSQLTRDAAAAGADVTTGRPGLASRHSAPACPSTAWGAQVGGCGHPLLTGHRVPAALRLPWLPDCKALVLMAGPLGNAPASTARTARSAGGRAAGGGCLCQRVRGLGLGKGWRLSLASTPPTPEATSFPTTFCRCRMRRCVPLCAQETPSLRHSPAKARALPTQASLDALTLLQRAKPGTPFRPQL